MDYCTKNGHTNELIFSKAKFGPKTNGTNGTVEDPKLGSIQQSEFAPKATSKIVTSFVMFVPTRAHNISR